METPGKVTRSFKLLMFLAVAALFLLVVRFYREEESPRESPTASEKRQHSPSEAPAVKQADTPDSPSTDATANGEMPKDTPKKLVRAWNQGSSQQLAGLFTPDGTLTMPNGSQIRSRSEIARVVEEKRAGVFSQTTLSNTVDEVSQEDGQTAVVKGRYQLDGIKVVGFTTSAAGTFVLRQIQRDGKWLISKAEIKTGGDG